MNDKKIKVGIVGVHPERGWASIAHVPALQALPQFEISAVSNSDPEQARLAAAKFGIANAVSSTDELVSHPDVDLVVVTVRVPHHLAIITKAIEAGKAVLSEWPLGVNLDEAVALASLAQQRKTHTTIGLQTRCAPAVSYARDLIGQGYVGEVLSSSLIVSGINWGEAMNKGFEYTLDSASGAGMLHVPVAHTLDALLHTLGSDFADLDASLAIRRKTSRMIETGDDAAMRTPDQIAISGSLDNGVFINAHFRGGLSKASNFHWEINGTKGDLLITNPIGYVGIGGFRLRGAQGQDELQDLPIPAEYGASFAHLGMAENVAIAYERLASDMLTGTHISPDFEDAIRLHRLVARIEANGRMHGND